MPRQKKPKTLLAMSGGVDSSVAAALLLRQGYDITGAFMKQWSDSTDLHGVCQWKVDRRDALRVAARLGIPLLTLDFEKEYRQSVTEYMFREYNQGRTPNPDVLCNTYIKFGAWLEKAKELGFDYLATGHYARVKEQKTRNKKQLLLAPCHLLLSRDKDKDQTYFLHQLSQDQLAHVLFPIGHLLKSEVRTLARKFKLPTAERAESMGICFVGEVPMKEFLQQKIKPKPGDIVMSSGEAALLGEPRSAERVVGEHEGLPFYTIGQRHFGERNKWQGTRNSWPLYVVGKNMQKNELIVGYENDSLLHKKEIQIDGMHWIAGRPPTFPLHCEVRLRHRQKLQKAKIKMKNDDITIEFANPQRAVTPGQFAVFYLKGECLGGGVIV